MIIRHATAADAAGIAAIYNDAVRHTTAVLVDTEVDAQNRADWMAGRQAQGYPVLVAVDGHGVPLLWGVDPPLGEEHDLMLPAGGEPRQALTELTWIILVDEQDLHRAIVPASKARFAKPITSAAMSRTRSGSRIVPSVDTPPAGR